MALKPYVTLSIANSIKENVTENVKMYYCENVYRSTSVTNNIEEIMQVGVENIGDIDSYAVCEMIALAIKSLQTISNRYILDVSHMGFVTGLLDCIEADDSVKDQLLKDISQKNAHEIRKACAENGIDGALCEKLELLATLYGSFDETLDCAKKITVNDKMIEALKELENIHHVLKLSGAIDCINLDFSIVNDMNYYNGIIFQGYALEIPSPILVGGSYDNLLKKLGKEANAIGYAIYMNLLEDYGEDTPHYDADILLLYDENTDVVKLTQQVNLFTQVGKSVCVQKTDSGGGHYAEKLKMTEKGVESVG